MRNKEAIINLENVELTLKGPESSPINILQNINAQVYKDDSLSITGPSGSGKTSLMMLIAGVEKPTSGRIIINNEDITNYNEDKLAVFRRKNIGIVFQNFHLIPTMTALENVMVALELAGNENAESLAIESLKSVGLEKRIHHYPAQLSGGEQQRVALARAFAARPSILLADEPTGNLDSENSRHIIELMFSLKEQHNTTLILITHDNELAAKTSRQFHILDGKLNEK